MDSQNQKSDLEITIENEEQLHEPHQMRKTKKKRFARADVWLKQHPRKGWLLLTSLLLVIGAGLLVAVSGSSILSVYGRETRTFPPEYYSKLTGLKVSKSDSERPVTAVMIENSPDARPQSGLAQADTVFESVAEGGITRFLVLYQEDKPSLIGPVRSVRPQFASLVAAYDAGLAHVGGSDIPLKKLRSGKIKDLDQFFNADTYWRATDRYAPHNVYTSATKLDALNKAKGYTKSEFTPWQRSKVAVGAKTPTARSITIPVSTGLFEVAYKWDKAKNHYVRSEGGAPHKDREKGSITPKVVIAMQVPHDVIRDSNGYSYPQVNSHGKAWIFQNGTVKEVKWSKNDDKSMISFTDSEGKAVTLSPGKTWVTLIRPDAKPTWK